MEVQRGENPVNEKLRLRATMTVEVEYEVDTASFGTDDPQKVVELEQMSFDRDPADLLSRDEAQHWIDVEDVTNAITPQVNNDVKPPLRFNVKGCQTGRVPNA